MKKINGISIGKMLYAWRYYTLGREQYNEYMKKTFNSNLASLWQANALVAGLVFCFSLFPILVENEIRDAGVYLAAAAIAVILAVFAHYRYGRYKQGIRISNLHIYLLTTLYYANFILFGIYIDVWANAGGLAVSFMIFLMYAFLLFTNSPLYNLLHTLCAIAVFIISSILIKEPESWARDILHVAIAGSVSLFFSWRITMLRMVSALNEGRLEEERNSYYNQSTVDELTKLKNRRDFKQTFQRRLTNYRSSDDWICIAIMDIDYFKNYNDFYGHLKGDDCLSAIGALLNNLRDSMNLYAARVGGEEFALIWYEKDPTTIAVTVSQIQRMINDLNIPHAKSKAADHITVSVGIHAIRCGASEDMDALYDLADKALYTAKRNGRNRAIIYSNLLGI